MFRTSKSKSGLYIAMIIEGLNGGGGGGPLVGCRLKFSYLVGSRLKFSISVGCRLIAVNK